MQLPDEAVAYQFQSLLGPLGEEWTPAAELRNQHFLPPSLLRDLVPRLLQVRGQIAAERDLKQVSPDLVLDKGPGVSKIGFQTSVPEPIEAGFIDLPQKQLDDFRRKGDMSILGRILALATRLRSQVDRVVVLGSGGFSFGARALFKALRSAYHNELPSDTRLGVPRIYFEGDSPDSDSLQELLDLLQTTCVDPQIREECWGVIVIGSSEGTLETMAALRAFRREAAEYYGLHSERLREVFVPVTGLVSRLRDYCRTEGFPEDALVPLPEDVGPRYSIFTPAGLLPAAVMDLDVRALLLGAATMTRRFLEEPFERNPVLQFAGVNYLMTTERHKLTRVLAVWSKKLEALGHWYDHLLTESLSKHGRGAMPLTVVQPRDLGGRGQQQLEGTRDQVVNNLVVRMPRQPAIMIGMADRNPDDLNQFNRKGLPDMTDAALRATTAACFDAARPTADLVLPALSEYTIGQLMQLLMLTTVVEGRLMGMNPYGQPYVEKYQKNLKALLKT
jgi:glucose-6-phosphate isomerase